MTQTTPEAEAPPSLETRLAEWIDENGIKGHYDTAGIAARVTAQVHHTNLRRWLDENAPYLRDMCRRIKDAEDLTLADDIVLGEWAAENYFHGHLAEDQVTA